MPRTPDMTHDDLPVSARWSLARRGRETPRGTLRDPRFLPRAHGRVPHSVSPHPRHAVPVKSPRKARRDHNSVYLRPTVVVSEGFRNLSVALGNFRAAGGGDGGTAPVKSASVARLTSRRATIDRRAIQRGGRRETAEYYYFAEILAPRFHRRSSRSIGRVELSVDLASR